MFEIGDLVELRTKGVVNSLRYHPDKLIGIIKDIERNSFWSYKGDYIDKVVVFWTPLGEEERIPETFLKKITKDT